MRKRQNKKNIKKDNKKHMVTDYYDLPILLDTIQQLALERLIEREISQNKWKKIAKIYLENLETVLVVSTIFFIIAVCIAVIIGVANGALG